MHIVYFDETGNTGTNMEDPQQAVFVLGALIVSEAQWQALESELERAMNRAFPLPRPETFEIRGGTLRNGEGYFRGFRVLHRIAFRDEWLSIALRFGAKFVYRAIEKARFHRWVQTTFGSGVKINPYIAAFPLVARVVDEFLAEHPGKPLGIFVFDENKEVVHDIEKSLRMLRGIDSGLRLGRIIEKGFFIDSSKSLILQLCDLCTYSARKKEEQERGLSARDIDNGGVNGIGPLLHRGNEAAWDVIAWVTEQLKKGAARS
ncbi:MAG: DUF3800 domain-containing protein [Phycisphaerae bacterium]